MPEKKLNAVGIGTIAVHGGNEPDRSPNPYRWENFNNVVIIIFQDRISDRI